MLTIICKPCRVKLEERMEGVAPPRAGVDDFKSVALGVCLDDRVGVKN